MHDTQHLGFTSQSHFYLHTIHRQAWSSMIVIFGLCDIGPGCSQGERVINADMGGRSPPTGRPWPGTPNQIRFPTSFRPALHVFQSCLPTGKLNPSELKIKSGTPGLPLLTPSSSWKGILWLGAGLWPEGEFIKGSLQFNPASPSFPLFPSTGGKNLTNNLYTKLINFHYYSCRMVW